MVRVAADESARALYAMMEDIVERASRLNLGKSSGVQRNMRSGTSTSGSIYPCSDAETFPDNQTGREGASPAEPYEVMTTPTALGTVLRERLPQK